MNVLLFREVPERALADLRSEFDRCIFRTTTSPRQLAEWLDWPDVVFGNAPAALLTNATQLQWLQIVSSGFDDYWALAGSSVVVTTGHGVHAPIIAQHVLLMFLLYVRGQRHFAACQRHHHWDREPALPEDPSALTVGLVGYGAVGREVARLLSPLGTRVIATKLTLESTPPDLDELLPWDRLDDLLAVSDHVILALPLSEATRHLIDAPRLSRLKQGAILHNVSRGQLVDETALMDRLRSGHLGGASLDVFAQEPLAAESPLWDLPNVVITPHVAGHHRDLGRLLLERFKENLRRRLRGEPLRHVADFTRGY